MKPSRPQAWFLACRPKTLSVSLSPVIIGTAIAWHDSGYILWLPLLAAALGAAFAQHMMRHRVEGAVVGHGGNLLRQSFRPLYRTGAAMLQVC